MIENCIQEEICNFLNNKEITHCCENYDDALNEYLNYLDRWIIAKKRKVILSKEIEEAQKTNESIFYFIRLFEEGADVNGHLSRKIYDSDYYDKLLTHWCIHHIHLNTKEAHSNSEMKKNRSDMLLFFLVADDFVFFIDVERHDKECVFSMYKLLCIIKNNWPFLMQKIPVVSVPKENVITRDEDFQKLFKANINYFISFENDLYMLSFGSTLAGTSLENRLLINNIKKKLWLIFKNQKNTISEMKVELLYPHREPLMKISWIENGITKEEYV